MTGPYEYNATDGILTISRTNDDGNVTFEVTGEPDAATATVPAEHLPALFHGICRAAGQKAPVVSYRPDVDLTEGLSLFDGLIGVAHENGTLFIRTTKGDEHAPTTAELREAGAQLIAFADRAAAEPHPDQVAELAQTLRDLSPSADDWAASTSEPVPYDALALGLLRRYEIKERTP